MFSTSLWGLIGAVLANIILAVLPWILFIWLCFGTKFKGVLLWLLGRFVGAWVVGHFLFDLQFIHFGIGIRERVMLCGILLVALGSKLLLKKWASLIDYIHTLRRERQWAELIKSYHQLSPVYKVLTRGGGVAVIWFLATSFVFTTNLPTYADDSFSNRNRPIVHILHDGGVTFFGAKEDILARGNLGYPIHVAMYKAVIADLLGWYNDIYTDLFQWFGLLFCFMFLFVITREKSKHILFSLAPAIAITTLPLVFFHSVESYHDLPVTIYAVITWWSLYQFLVSREVSYLTLWLLCSYLMSYIKIEGLVIYAAGLFLTAGVFVLRNHKLRQEIRASLTKNFTWIRENVLLFIFFFLPFQVVRIFHGLGFNPSSIQTGEVLDKKIHREIFGTFDRLFFGQDNYGIALAIFVLMIVATHRFFKRKNTLVTYLFWSSIAMFVLFTLVFLLTNNYQWLMSQTTVNRVYTMCFFVLFAFIWLYLYERDTK